ncbi:MAG: hypothetical protein ACR2IP_14605 [Solirubrobacteraceae bacterium]
MRRSSALLALLALLAALGGGLLPVSAAGAGGPGASAGGAVALRDCNLKNRLTRTYSVAELRQALSTMSVDVKEYTNCYDVIRSQLLAQISASHRTGTAGAAAQGSGGSFLPTPLIVVLVVLALGAGGFAVTAVRRRRALRSDVGH